MYMEHCDDQFDSILLLLQEMEHPDYTGDYNKIDTIKRHIRKCVKHHAFYRISLSRLNRLVIARNRQCIENKKTPPHGVIVQLVEFPTTYLITMAALMCAGECQECFVKFSFVGNTMLDVYAPALCPKCKSPNIDIIQYKREYQSVDQRVPPRTTGNKYIKRLKSRCINKLCHTIKRCFQ